MKHAQTTPDKLTDRRGQPRRAARHAIGVSRIMPVLPIGDAEVLNTSPDGVAIRTRVPLKAGGRLSFTLGNGKPPILAEILGVEPEGNGSYRVRCRCLLGEFEH